MRKLRFETNLVGNKENSAYRHSRSKSAQKKINEMTRTPRVRKQISAFEYTPERVSMWRG